MTKIHHSAALLVGGSLEKITFREQPSKNERVKICVNILDYDT